MSAKPEINLYAHVQQKGVNGEIDVYRINLEQRSFAHETFECADRAETTLQKRAENIQGDIRKSENYLAANLAIALVLFAESLRHKSKVLFAAGIFSSAIALYVNEERKIQQEELDWVEREALALENHSHNLIIQPH